MTPPLPKISPRSPVRTPTPVSIDSMPQLSAVITHKMTVKDVLTKYGWYEDDPASDMRALWNEYWGEELEPRHMECFPRWQEALSSTHEERVPELIEMAERFGVIGAEEPNLPGINYYNVGAAWRVETATSGRLIELDQYPDLRQNIRTLRAQYRQSGVVVTGQPGNGNTYFMFYFLIHALARAEPVVLSLGAAQHYLFLADNIWKLKIPMADPDSSSRYDLMKAIPKGTWALIDCDVLSSAPSGAFSAGLLFFPVYFARPHMGRYDSLFAVSHPPFLRVMRPVTSREIVACCFVLSPEWGSDDSPAALKVLLEHMGLLGLAPKPCIESMRSGSVDGVCEDLLTAIAKISLAQLQQILISLDRVGKQGLAYTSIDVKWKDTFEALFIIQRVPGWPSDRMTLSFASPWILHRLIEEFTLKQEHKTRSFISLLLKDYRRLGTATGIMFELLMHHVLSAAPEAWDGRYELKEFDLGASSERAKFNPNAITVENIVRKRSLRWYFNRLPPTFDSDVYLVPDAANNPGFDSVVYDFVLPDVAASPSDVGVRGRSLPRRRATVTGQTDVGQRDLPVSGSAPPLGRRENRSGTDIDFETAAGPGYISGRSVSAGTRASASIQPMGPSPTPFLSHSRSASRLSSAYAHSRAHSRAQSWAADERTPGVKFLKRPRSAMDGPPSSKTGNKVPKVWDETQHCIALQMTIADEHGVSTKGLDRLMSSFEPRRGSWSFVFVTPRSRPMNMKAQLDILMELDEDWRNRFRWYNLIVDIAHPGYLDIGLDVITRSEQQGGETDQIDGGEEEERSDEEGGRAGD